MRRPLALALCVLWCAGCGPYRIRYLNPSQANEPTYARKIEHSHGFGPLIIGGGGFFFLLNPMSPALIDYTGPVRADLVCPDGFSEVSHYHTFAQQTAAAFLSWLVIVNAYHLSYAEWQCLE